MSQVFQLSTRKANPGSKLILTLMDLLAVDQQHLY